MERLGHAKRRNRGRRLEANRDGRKAHRTSRVARLAPAQRALLRSIANADGGVEQPTANEFLSPIRLAPSTASRAKDVLEQEDLIRREDDGRWRLVDPVVDFCLRRL